MPKTFRRRRFRRGLRGRGRQAGIVLMVPAEAWRRGRRISLPDPEPVTGCMIRDCIMPVVPHAHRVTRIDYIRAKLGTGPWPGSEDWLREQHGLAVAQDA